MSNLLKHYREQRRLTQEEVAEYTGYTQATVSRHENGDHDVSRSARLAYARLYGVPIHDIFPDHAVLDMPVPPPVAATA